MLVRRELQSNKLTIGTHEGIVVRKSRQSTSFEQHFIDPTPRKLSGLTNMAANWSKQATMELAFGIVMFLLAICGFWKRKEVCSLYATLQRLIRKSKVATGEWNH